LKGFQLFQHLEADGLRSITEVPLIRRRGWSALEHDMTLGYPATRKTRGEHGDFQNH
jgi:hypothetical protein